MLLIDLDELGNRYMHLVWAPDQIGLVQRGFVLNALAALVVLNRVIDRVWDLRKRLTVLTVAKLFLVHFNLVSSNKLAWCHFHILVYDRHDQVLDRVLLFVVNADPHMSAIVDCVLFQAAVGNSLIVGDRPVIVEE